MNRILVSLALACLVSTTTASAETKVELVGETEFAADGPNGDYVSQYLFLNIIPDTGVQWNGLWRYYNVKRGPEHAEFEFGPTLSLGEWGILQNSFGFTTDGSITTGHTLLTTIVGKPVVYIADPKWYLNKTSSELFQKLIVSDVVSILGVPISLRVENLLLDHVGNVFLRIGPQIPLAQSLLDQYVGHNATVTIGPFYEVESGKLGSFLTFTFAIK